MPEHVWLAQGYWCECEWVIGVYSTLTEAKQGCARSETDMIWNWSKDEDRADKVIASQRDTFPFGKIFMIERVEINTEISIDD